MKPIHLNESNFESEAVRASVPVLIDFYADWCGPCRLLAPTVEEIAAEAEGFLVAKVNVDEAPALAERFGVMSIPTLVVLKGGEAVARAVGVRPKAAILSLLESVG